MAEFRDDEERLERSLYQGELAMMRALRAAHQQALRDLSLSVIRRLLTAGGVRAVVNRYARSFARAYSIAQERVLWSARDVAAAISRDLGVRFVVDIGSPALGSAARDLRARLDERTRSAATDAATAAIVWALARGVEPARRIRDTLGLTRAQVEALVRHEALLERTRAGRERGNLPEELERSLEEDGALGTTDHPGAAERALTAFASAALLSGWSTLSVDVAQAAANAGEEIAFEQALGEGLIEGLTWEWLTARDERVRPSHRAMQGQVRPDGEAFISGDGNRLRWPGDPEAPRSETARCRCRRRARAGAVEEERVA